MDGYQKMECSVCYSETGPFRALSCNHSFCSGCIKNWYLKGTGSGCPMCRRPIYFKGFSKIRNDWNDEAWETKCNEIFVEFMDDCINDAFQMASSLPNRYRKSILSAIIDDIKETERTFSVMKKEKYDSEDIEFVLNETDACLSDRWKSVWYNEPVKHKAVRLNKNIRRINRYA